MAFDSRYEEEQIDWSRLAAPQTNGYDTTFILSCIGRAGHVRPEIGHCQTIFDGKVTVGTPPEGTQAVSSEAPNLEHAVSLLTCWPAVYHQFPKIIHTVFPFVMPGDPKYGSSSAHVPGNLGAIYVSVFDPIGTSEALVHELAHQKLFALGVDFESACRIVLNSSDEVYPSPVRVEPRPMTAVLHAVYAWLHIVNLDLRMLSVEVECDEETDPDVLDTFVHRYLNRNIQNLVPAFDVVEKNITCDAVGQDFLRGLCNWKSRLMDENHKLLDKIAQC